MKEGIDDVGEKEQKQMSFQRKALVSNVQAGGLIRSYVTAYLPMSHD
jgi:hypothetical protein